MPTPIKQCHKRDRYHGPHRVGFLDCPGTDVPASGQFEVGDAMVPPARAVPPPPPMGITTRPMLAGGLAAALADLENLQDRSAAGEALYWAIYYGHGDWVRAVFGGGSSDAFCKAYQRMHELLGAPPAPTGVRCPACGLTFTNPPVTIGGPVTTDKAGQ